MRDTLVRRRAASSAATAASSVDLEVLVLAGGRRSCVGVDLATGAFVRTHQQVPQPEFLAPFTVAAARRSPRVLDRPEQPEAVALSTALEPLGELRGWRADRILRPLQLPRDRHILGMQGPSVPCWTLDRSRPSVALVALDSEVIVSVTERGVRASFAWNGYRIDAPLEDPAVLGRLDWFPERILRGRRLIDIVGFRPERLVMALSRPQNGHCYRVVASLLPRH